MEKDNSLCRQCPKSHHPDASPLSFSFVKEKIGVGRAGGLGVAYTQNSAGTYK